MTLESNLDEVRTAASSALLQLDAGDNQDLAKAIPGLSNFVQLAEVLNPNFILNKDDLDKFLDSLSRASDEIIKHWLEVTFDYIFSLRSRVGEVSEDGINQHFYYAVLGRKPMGMPESQRNEAMVRVITAALLADETEKPILQMIVSSVRAFVPNNPPLPDVPGLAESAFFYAELKQVSSEHIQAWVDNNLLELLALPTELCFQKFYVWVFHFKSNQHIGRPARLN